MTMSVISNSSKTLLRYSLMLHNDIVYFWSVAVYIYGAELVPSVHTRDGITINISSI